MKLPELWLTLLMIGVIGLLVASALSAPAPAPDPPRYFTSTPAPVATYVLDCPVPDTSRMKAGDTMTVRCTYKSQPQQSQP